MAWHGMARAPAQTEAAESASSNVADASQRTLDAHLSATLAWSARTRQTCSAGFEGMRAPKKVHFSPSNPTLVSTPPLGPLFSPVSPSVSRLPRL